MGFQGGVFSSPVGILTYSAVVPGCQAWSFVNEVVQGFELVLASF